MIKIKVKAKRSWPVETRELVREAAYWAADRLNIDLRHNNITIKLMGFRDDLRGDEIRLGPNKFLVHLHARWSRPPRILFHEFTHIKQHIYDGLGFSDAEGVSLWRNAPYHHDVQDYWILPWEMEANRVEFELYKEFIDQRKNNP